MTIRTKKSKKKGGRVIYYMKKHSALFSLLITTIIYFGWVYVWKIEFTQGESMIILVLTLFLFTYMIGELE